MSKLWQAVVIDDLVNLSALPVSCSSPTESEGQAMHSRAQGAYTSEAILGAPEKDVVGEQLFKAIGAEIDSRDPEVARGCVPVAAPLSRRVPLAALSLRAAALPVTTPRLLNRLSGAWVSVALFRRCTMALFGKVFGEESRAPAASSASGAVPQPRLLAQHLCLAAALMPLMATDVTTPFCNKVFATDASLGLGAFCSTEVSPPLAQSIWLNGDRRGAYARLSTGAASLLEALGVETAAEESRDVACFAVPSAGLPFRLDLVEVGLPAPFVSAEAAALGLQVGPPFHPRHSPFFNLANPDLLVWFYSVLKAGYIKALVLHSPAVPGLASLAVHGAPCATGASPATLRYQRRCQVLARRCRFLLAVAARFGRPTLLLERGSRGAPTSLPATAPAACRFTVAACAFGGKACGDWQALAVWLNPAPLQRPCPCSIARRAASSLGFPDAPGALPDGFAWCAAKVFFSAVRQPEPKDNTSRLESLVCNDLLSAASWKVDCVIPWRAPHHINVLELSTLGALLRRLATQAPDSRVSVLLDSVVAKAAAAKGRSTSLALSPALAQACAVQLAYGIYASLGFAPTRLNTADAPSRRRELETPAWTLVTSLLSAEAVHGLGSLRFSKSLASWARLFLVATLRAGPPSRLLCDSWAGRHAALAAPYVADCRRDFDFTLGFPGEGPPSPWSAFGSFAGPECPLWHSGPFSPLSQLACFEARAPTSGPSTSGPPSFFCTQCLCILFLALSWVLPLAAACAAPFAPFDFDSSLGFPGEGWGRPTTRTNRARLLEAEKIAMILVLYGQQLFRSLGAAWDLAFAWLSEEPHAHHRALPRGVLLAVVSAALCWGWLREAALFMLAWTGLLRIGEAVSATRRDLILPSDAAPGTTFALLQIRAPKTRGRAAKHQASHIDPPDAVQLLELAFGHLQPSARLWPMSSGALRRRFRLLQSRFGLVNTDGSPHFDLSSFRPGGATWMLHCTENPDLVRRRGRWLSLRVMEIYLQEVEAITYLPSLSADQRDFLKLMAESFPALLRKASFFQRARIPTELESIRILFEDADCDGSGTLEEHEFVQILADEAVKNTLTRMEVPVDDPTTLFEILDPQGSGSISFPIFAQGVLRVKGPPTQLDMKTMQVGVAGISRRVSKVEHAIEDHRKLIQQSVQMLGQVLEALGHKGHVVPKKGHQYLNEEGLSAGGAGSRLRSRDASGDPDRSDQDAMEVESIGDANGSPKMNKQVSNDSLELLRETASSFEPPALGVPVPQLVPKAGAHLPGQLGE
ncbi:hypothetical protein AK812_SmicGene40547 [Symbiodinium microadriaticum]|uniref:EF-hand domain-containing protein n=1 Tax=Symbiodinium microadriaticum TaxID=2951 RepID=A0A1Q9C8F7_SYMMI|nr:hypothetical protein AK812_SmicGene40547 [Symbiodinium microadriaticum]